MAQSTAAILVGALLVVSLAGAVVCLAIGVLLPRGRRWAKGASALGVGAVLLLLVVHPALEFRILLVTLLIVTPACFAGGIGYLCRRRWDKATVLFCTGGAVGLVLWAPVTLMTRWPEHECARALLMSSFVANIMALALCPIGAIYQLRKGRFLWGLLLVCLFAQALLFTAPGYLPFSWGPRPWRYWTATYYDRVMHENCYTCVRTEGIRYAVDRIRAGGPEAERYAVDLRELVEHPQSLKSEEQRAALKQAVLDLRVIQSTASPEAHAAAGRALGWLKRFAPELFGGDPSAQTGARRSASTVAPRRALGQAQGRTPGTSSRDTDEAEARVAVARDDGEAAVLCERLLGDFERARSHLLRRGKDVQQWRKRGVAIRLARCSAHLGRFTETDIWLARAAGIDRNRRPGPAEEEIALCRRLVPVRESYRKAYVAEPSLENARELFDTYTRLREYASMRRLAADISSRFEGDPWLASEEFQSAAKFLAAYYAPLVEPEPQEQEPTPARNPQVGAIFGRLRANRKAYQSLTRGRWDPMTLIQKAKALRSYEAQGRQKRSPIQEVWEPTEQEAVKYLRLEGLSAKGHRTAGFSAWWFEGLLQVNVTPEELRAFNAGEAALVDELAGVGEPALADLLAKLDDSPEGLWAQKALAQMGEEAIPALTREIKAMCDLAKQGKPRHEQWVKMRHLVRALASQRSPHAIPGLRLALDHPDTEVCSKALYALADIPDGLTQDILLRLWEHENARVRRNAASYLSRSGDEKAIKVFERDIPTAYAEARYEAEQAIWHIRRRLGLPRGKRPERRGRPGRVPWDKGPDWEGIERSIDSPNRGIRITAINRLECGTPRAENLGPLKRVMQRDPDAGVRLRATRAFVRVFRLYVSEAAARAEDLGLLKRLMQTDPDAEVRLYATEALARVFSRCVSEAAARGEDLARFSAGFDALAGTIRQGEEGVVTAGLGAAGVFRRFSTRPGYGAIVKRVFAGLDSQSIALRAKCLFASVVLFRSDADRPEWALSPARTQAMERAILSGLSSDCDRYMDAAIHAARMLGFSGATPALVGIVKDGRRRRSAASALAQIGDARAIPALEHMAYTDPFVDWNGLYSNREIAWKALRSIRQRTGRPAPSSTPHPQAEQRPQLPAEE